MSRDRLRVAWSKTVALVRRRRLERELEEELAFHLDMRAARNREEGLAPAEASAAAERRFGRAFTVKEQCRDSWSFERLTSLRQDVRLALRGLRNAPAFAAVAILSLAIAIGANAAVFSLVHAVLLQPLPYPQADRLVRLAGFYPKGALVALQAQARTMDVAGATPDLALNLTGQGDAERLVGSAVSANLFQVLGAGAARGRALAPGDDQPGRDDVVVLSHALWESRFGADPQVLGRVLTLDGTPRRVVGVMPRGFAFPLAAAQLWIPLRLDPSRTEDYWGFGWMPLVARLRPGVTLAQADGDLREQVVRVAGLFPWNAPNWNPNAAVVPLQGDVVRDVRPRILVLQAAVALVLLIACANVASLLLARAAARQKEMALRASLGAGRPRLLRQLLTESLTLALVGGGLGIVLAWFALAGAPVVFPGEEWAREVRLDGTVLAWVSGLSLLCGVFFGVVPSLAASRVDLATAVKTGGSRSAARSALRVRSAFIAGEVALAVVLTVGAGLLVRTLWGLTSADPGFRPESTVTVGVHPNASDCAARAQCVALYDDLLQRARQEPGVAEVALASAAPLAAEQPLLPMELEGHPLDPADPQAALLWSGAVTPSYFRLLRIPILRGRGFQETDGAGAAPVVIVSAETARRYWPGQDPIGKTVRVVWDEHWRTVVGVAGEVRQYALSGRAPEGIAGALYMPYAQAVALDRRLPRTMTLLVRASAPAREVAPRLRPLIARVNPDVPVSDVRTLEALVDASVSKPRALMWTFAAFSACALLLAAIGTYGIVSFQVSQRTYEIGVRLAIGASRRHVFGLVIGHGVRLVVVGLAIGLGAAMLLGRVLSTFLYGVTATDPLTFAAVSLLLLAAAFVAAWGPGRRAARTDLVRALRAD
jgi:putative ABC transport system permease protein